MAVMGRVCWVGPHVGGIGGVVVALVILTLSLWVSPAWAQPVELDTRLVSAGVLGDTGNGASFAGSLSSADGRYVAYSSLGQSFLEGIVDANHGHDVFLHDRLAGTTVLVSHSATSATVTANGPSVATAISADGGWVLFRSTAADVVAGVTDSNGYEDVFLYERSSGEVRLISRSASSAAVTANNRSVPTSISADGGWVLFQSQATDVVAGITDSNSTFDDVFLYERSSGAVRLVSQSASSGIVTANGPSVATAISADGGWVLFRSAASNVVAGVTDSNGYEDVFLYQRSTGLVSLVSRSAGSAAVTADGGSYPTAISAEGDWVVFGSQATNLVAGVTDSNGNFDVFLYQRSTGAVRLVSRSASSATVTVAGVSSPSVISADGEWVLFRSSASNVVAGVTDSNGSDDVFLYQRSTGVVSLVSRSASSAAVTVNRGSVPTAISADGAWVLFESGATDVVAGVTDSNDDDDVFLYQRSSGAVSLVSRSASSASVTANFPSSPIAINADGEWVLFTSLATNLVAGVTDNNGTSSDLFLYQRSSGAVSLVSRSDTSAIVSANLGSSPRAISADGEWVVFSSHATNLIDGATDSNRSVDVFLYQRSSGALSLVSRSATSATVTAKGNSEPAAMSADGEWVLFSSVATNLVAGVTDNNLGEDVFLYQRSTGAVRLVSRSAASATVTANSRSFPVAISSDGEWVLFGSPATDVVAGVTDTNVSEDVFLYQRSTGAVSLVSRSTASSMVTANGDSYPVAITPDSEWVLFGSRATDVVAGVTDSSSSFDVFLYHRSSGAVSLISRSASSAAVTANNNSDPVAISPDGEWVLFQSRATDVVAGVTDSNSNIDVFLYQRSSGAVYLVSRSATSATVTANRESHPAAISADGEWVLFGSEATDVVAGVTDSNNSLEDVFLYQRSSGAVSLVSRSAGSAIITANLGSQPTAMSANGEWVLFESRATDVVAGVTDGNGYDDVFLYQRSSGAVNLVSRSAVSATVTADNESQPTAISADGAWVLFRSDARNLISGVLDNNASFDVFLTAVQSSVFGDGFEPSPPTVSESLERADSP